MFDRCSTRTTAGGCELGINRKIPQGKDFYAIARSIEDLRIDGLLMIGGWSGYDGCLRLAVRRDAFPAFSIPIICLPATINNNLPGSELSVGADTALNAIVEAVDKIKQSAVASRRCFVVEVMGRYCGYLALMAGLASGAERVYLNEEGVSIADLQADVEDLVAGFQAGKRLGLMIRSEKANDCYSTQFMVSLFEEEGDKVFEVRQAVLGQEVRRNASQVAFTGCDFRYAEPPLGEVPLACPGIHEDGQPAGDPEEAHGGKQEGLHDLAGLVESIKLAGGIVQGLQVKYPSVQVCRRPGGPLDRLL